MEGTCLNSNWEKNNSRTGLLGRLGAGFTLKVSNFDPVP